ncbi:hypothetical protein EBZ80_21695 [bacterium]|nr:hypothetical protein [bacterium]
MPGRYARWVVAVFVIGIAIGFIQICPPLHRFFQGCVYRGTEHRVLHSLRSPAKRRVRCLVTRWNANHLVVYTVLGYLFPDSILLWFVIGAVWEVAEIWFDCCDMTDLLYNAVGLLLGRWLFLRVRDGKKKNA